MTKDEVDKALVDRLTELCGIDTDFDQYGFSIKRESLRGLLRIIKALVEENARLTEVAQRDALELMHTRRKVENLRAENERKDELRTISLGRAHVAEARAIAAESKAETMREALVRVASCKSYHSGDVVDIARAALSAHKGEG